LWKCFSKNLQQIINKQVGVEPRPSALNMTLPALAAGCAWYAALILVIGSQPAGDASHKPGGRLPLLTTRPAVTPATLKRAATSFAVW